MPEVDNDRHNLLENLTKVFYEECDADIDKELALHTGGLPELAGKMSVEDIDEIKDELFNIRDEYHDKTKELSEFRKPCKNDLYCENCGMYSEYLKYCGSAALHINRPPQSWCYVEKQEK